MKGLFLNNFYATTGDMRLFLALALVGSAWVIITGDSTALEIFVYIIITALAVHAVGSSRKDADSRWNKFEITMPVRRKEIIQCKFLSYLFWVIAGTALALLVTIIATWIHSGSIWLYGFGNVCSMFALGIGIAMMTGACFYPVSYLVGVEKSETVLEISVLAAVGAAIVILNILNRFIDSFAVRMTVFIAGYLLLFALSYGITFALYLKKEF